MSKKGWTLFVALGIIWGIPYLLIRVAVADYHPVIVAFGRSTIGAFVLLPFVLRRQALLSGFQRPGWLLLYTLAEISGPWFLIGYAETQVTSSLAGLIVALTPILASTLNLGISGERFGAGRLLGLCLGLAGVLALLRFEDQALPIWPVVALGLSAGGYAVGPLILARKLADADATAVVVASLVLASLIYLPATLPHWPARLSGDATIAVIVLAVLCTAIAFRLLFSLIAEVGPARATVIAYLNPAVAVLLGVLVLDEPLSANLVIGSALIVAGSYFATGESARTESETDRSRSTPEAG